MRKTAAICVAKLFDINAELVQDRGFLDTLVVGVLMLILGFRGPIDACWCWWQRNADVLL